MGIVNGMSIHGGGGSGKTLPGAKHPLRGNVGAARTRAFEVRAPPSYTCAVERRLGRCARCLGSFHVL